MAYSDAFVSECLIRLALNKYDFEKTSQQVGIPARTLHRWEADKTIIKKGIPELLERAIEKLLMGVPDTMPGHDWAIAVGILIDKLQLIQGRPTSRTETFLGLLEAIPDNELDSLIAEFQTATNTAVIEGGESKAESGGAS